MMTLREKDLRRLNVLLRLPGRQVDGLSEAEWNALLDDLYFAVLGETGRVFKDDAFHSAARPELVRVAQEGLHAQLPVLQRIKGKDPAPSFKLKAQTLYIGASEEGFASMYLCDDGVTMIYSTLAYLLERSKVTQRDILSCANPRCEAFFVPLRKPHAGQRNFCSQRCGSLNAARDYRSKKGKMLKAKEKERSRKRYQARIEKGLPGARIKRGPHNPQEEA